MGNHKNIRICLGSILYCFKTLSFTIQPFVVTCVLMSNVQCLLIMKHSQSIPFYISIIYDSEKFVLIYLLSSDSSINFPFQINKSIVFESAFQGLQRRLFPSVSHNVQFSIDRGSHCFVSNKQH